MSVQMIAIEFTGVTKRFDNGSMALDGVTFNVREREFFVVLGGSGSGKTTMLRMINRLTAPTAGTVKVGDVDVQALDPILLRRRREPRSRDDAPPLWFDRALGENEADRYRRRVLSSARMRSITPMNGSSFDRTGGLLRRQPGGTENFNIFETILGSIPERRAAGARDSARLRWAFCEGECCGLAPPRAVAPMKIICPAAPLLHRRVQHL